MPSRHAEISPSTFEYREMCDFWAPDTSQEDPVMATRGTAIHAAIEKNDLSLCKEPEDIPVAKLCLRYLDHVRAQHGGETLQESHEIEVPVLSQFGTTDYLLEDLE